MSDSEVLAVRADIGAVRAALMTALQTADWMAVTLRDGHVDVGPRPGLILQLPSQQWTLFISLGGRWSTIDVAEQLSENLKTTTLAYRRNDISERLATWHDGKPVRSNFRVGDRVEGFPEDKADFRTLVLRILSEQSLYLPAACDGDPARIAALLSKYPTARAHAFRFSGTSGRIFPPSSWVPLRR